MSKPKIHKIKVTGDVKLSFNKAMFTSALAVENVKTNYEPCNISVDDLTDAKNHILTLTPLSK